MSRDFYVSLGFAPPLYSVLLENDYFPVHAPRLLLRIPLVKHIYIGFMWE